MPLNHSAKKVKSYMLVFIVVFVAPAFYAEWRTIDFQLAGLQTLKSEILGAQKILKLVTPLNEKVQVDNLFLAELRGVSDRSTLILDPREDTYYWVDTVVNFFPNAIGATPEQLSFLLERQEHAFSRMRHKCSPDCSPLAVEANATIDAIRGKDLKGHSFESAKSAWMRSTLVLHELLTKYSELEKAKVRSALLIGGIVFLLSALIIWKVLSSALANIEALKRVIVELEAARSSAL